MFSVLCIVLGCVACTYLLSKADIRITITHRYPAHAAQQPTASGVTQEQADKAYEEADTPSFDDVLTAVKEALGGLGDE